MKVEDAPSSVFRLLNVVGEAPDVGNLSRLLGIYRLAIRQFNTVLSSAEENLELGFLLGVRVAVFESGRFSVTYNSLDKTSLLLQFGNGLGIGLVGLYTAFCVVINFDEMQLFGQVCDVNTYLGWCSSILSTPK